MMTFHPRIFSEFGVEWHSVTRLTDTAGEGGNVHIQSLGHVVIQVRDIEKSEAEHKH